MNKSTKRILFWSGAALVIAISVFVVMQGAAPTVDNNVSADKIVESDWTKGNPEAKVTLIEYSDFQCPACGRFAAIVDTAMKEYENHVYFAYRHYPLKSIHPNATLAARAANAAGEQGKFFDMHNLIFLNTAFWAEESADDAEGAFIEFAAGIDLDPKKFYEDYNSEENIQSVEDSYNHAIKAGLTYTPSFFLNGELIKMPSDQEAFNQILRDAVEAAK